MKAEKNDLVTIAKNAVVSGSFQVPRWAVFCGCYLPAADDGSVGIEWSADGTNFYPIIDPVDGADAIACASGSDPGVFDFSDWVRFVHHEDYLRFTSATTQTTAALALKIRFRG